jgi:hypothetical protein
VRGLAARASPLRRLAARPPGRPAPPLPPDAARLTPPAPSPPPQGSRPAAAGAAAPRRAGHAALAPPPCARWRQAAGLDAQAPKEPAAAAPAPPAAPVNGNGNGAAKANGNGTGSSAYANGNGNSNGATARADPPPGLSDAPLINSQFASVLSAALSRSGDGALTSGSSYEEPRETPLKPVEEMVLTALHSSRASLRRLVERQSQLEAEIAREQKQAERLEWLLNRVRPVEGVSGADVAGRQATNRRCDWRLPFRPHHLRAARPFPTAAPQVRSDYSYFSALASMTDSD